MKKWNQQYHDKFKAFALIHKVWDQKNLEMVIKSINPVIRGWGNYFKCGTVKKSFGELDGYIRRKLHTGNPSVQFDEEVEVGRPLLYSTHGRE